MFFILSKTLGYLIRPIVVICLMLAASLLLKKPVWKKRLLYGGIILLFFFSNEFIANEAMNAWEFKAIPFSQVSSTYTYGILLCGATKENAGPKDRVYIGSAADRINHTLQLYKLGLIRKIVVSGGSGALFGADNGEAEELASLLRLMGVPAEDILLESTSRNTHESGVNVKKLLEGIASPSDCLLITSASHMRRATASFSKAGWPCDPFPADFHGHFRQYKPDVLLVPKLEALMWWHILFKETTGYAAYWMAGYI